MYHGVFLPAFMGSLKIAIPPASRSPAVKLKASAGELGRARSLTKRVTTPVLQTVENPSGGPAMRTHILPTLAYDYGITQSQLGLGAAVLVSVIPVFVVLIVLLTRRMLASKN